MFSNKIQTSLKWFTDIILDKKTSLVFIKMFYILKTLHRKQIRDKTTF